MSFLSIDNIKITGVSACVPKEVEEVKSYSLFSQEDAMNFSKNTGVQRRRKAPFEVCSSDLCLNAAEKLIAELKWNKAEIDCLVFVTQTPDYTLPATSASLQSKLGLSTNCYTLDVSLGCSGWVLGIWT
jgi:3-oxoacyl-[acyl-carrier-protein] synthase-3